jgi:transcriptional regulator with XRE-family HTH domain
VKSITLVRRYVNMAVRRVISRHEELRRSAGLGVTELARRIGVDHAVVSRVEGGQKLPSAKYRAAVAAILGVPEGFIFPQADDQ